MVFEVVMSKYLSLVKHRLALFYIGYHSSTFFCSDEVREAGFTVIIDMRGSTWNTVKPILKELAESFTPHIYAVYIVKPDNFWQKQRTSIGSHKYKFEVSQWTIFSLYTFTQLIYVCSR